MPPLVLDIFTMADQALKHKLFDAAVVFYQVLVNQIPKKKSPSERFPLYFNNFQISNKMAKHLLERAKKIHDEVLASKGQFGLIHRCTSEPYRSTTAIYNHTKPMSHHTERISNREMVYRFKRKVRRKRTLLGRTKWVGDYKLSETERNKLQLLTVQQQDKLCTGEQIKVDKI